MFGVTTQLAYNANVATIAELKKDQQQWLLIELKKLKIKNKILRILMDIKRKRLQRSLLPYSEISTEENFMTGNC